MKDVFYKAAFLIQEEKDFDTWEWNFSRNYLPTEIDGLGTVKVIEIVKPNDTTSLDYYGEYPQGYEGEMTMVFEVTTPDEVLYVQKSGTVNSYGSERWDGKLAEVRPITKSVTAFEKV